MSEFSTTEKYKKLVFSFASSLDDHESILYSLFEVQKDCIKHFMSNGLPISAKSSLIIESLNNANSIQQFSSREEMFRDLEKYQSRHSPLNVFSTTLNTSTLSVAVALISAQSSLAGEPTMNQSNNESNLLSDNNSSEIIVYNEFDAMNQSNNESIVLSDHTADTIATYSYNDLNRTVNIKSVVDCILAKMRHSISSELQKERNENKFVVEIVLRILTYQYNFRSFFEELEKETNKLRNNIYNEESEGMSYKEKKAYSMKGPSSTLKKMQETVR